MSNLQEAFREAARREFLHVPAEEELHYVFSARFQRNMRRMIRANTYGYWNMVNTAAKRAAIVAALIVLLLSSVMAIKPVRDRVIQFFVEVYEEYFEIRFGEEEKDDIDPMPKPMVRYTLTELPEGYEETEIMDLDSLLWTNWENEERQKITLQQEPGTHEIVLNSKAAPIKYLEVGELRIASQREEVSTFVWNQDGIRLSLRYTKIYLLMMF